MILSKQKFKRKRNGYCANFEIQYKNHVMHKQ
jgi:hypothetical protein